jgi:hypothetical protein
MKKKRKKRERTRMNEDWFLVCCIYEIAYIRTLV